MTRTIIHPSTAILSATLTRVAIGIALAIPAFFVAPRVSAAEIAARSEQAMPFSIPAQPLEDALNDFIAVTDWQVGFPAELAKGARSPGVAGSYPPDKALKKLLAGTGLVYRHTGARAVTLERAPEPIRLAAAEYQEVQLSPIMVKGEATTEDKGQSYAVTRSSTATKTDMPIMETPMSVQVVSRTVMDDQQVITVEDAIKNVSGVQRDWGYGSLNDSFIIRGFPTRQSSVYRNGFRMTGYAAETANVESIDVLKGPAAMLYGRVDPGGIVNIVTKKPLSEPYYSLQQQFGSYDLYRTTADATGPITGNDALLYRFNLSYTNADSFRDFVFTDRIFVAPSLTWRLSEDTEFNLNFEYKNTDFTLDHGIPAVGKRPAKVPISRNLGERGTETHTDDYLVDFNWSHRFNENWRIRNGFVAHLQDYFLETIVHPFLRPDNRSMGRFANFTDYERHQYGSYIDLTGHFQTFGIRHNVLVGADWYEYHQESVGSFRPVTDIDIYNPVYGTVDLNQHRVFRDHAPTDFFTATTEWFGLYFQDQITLWDKLHILGGGRHDWARSKSGFSDVSMAAIDQTVLETERFQPRVGILYQPWPWLSVYGNYVESLGADNPGRSASGEPLKPETAEQFEAGVKTELLDGRLTGSLAYFHIEKLNMQTADISTPDPNDQVTVGKARSQGIEFDLKGQLTDSLSLIATYAYIDGRILKDNGGNEGNRLPNVPEHSGSFWAKYDFFGTALDGFSVGTGVYVAGQREGDNENTFQLPGYVRWDAMAAYRFRVGPTRMTAQVNVNNILDKTYYKSTDIIDGNPRGRITVAEPLTVLGSIRLEY